MDYFERAAELEARGDLKLAVPLFIAAARAAPGEPEPWIRAGNAALELGEPALAARILQECVERFPRDRRATSKLMVARLRLGEFSAAAALSRRVLELDPQSARALVMLGHLSPVLGAPEEARSWYEAAFEVERQHGIRKIDSVVARLLSGDYRSGWGCYHPDSTVPVPPRWVRKVEPVWRGEAARTGTVCVHTFGGLGDVLLFARYVPLIAERVRRVVVTAPAVLDRVLESVDGLSGVVRRWSDAGAASFIGALQLPSIFGTTLQTVPSSFPYLRAPSSGPRLPAAGGFRIGLAWAGNPELWTDPDRSVPSADLLHPLVRVPDVEWVSLQVGARAEWADELGIGIRPVLRDFGDTARVLQQLDLVITVDTAVANLAPAMGVPTWVLPPTYPDFRWGAPGQPSPWYPAARLFRRRHTGEWNGALGRVVDALRAELAEHRLEARAMGAAGRSATLPSGPLAADLRGQRS